MESALRESSIKHTGTLVLWYIVDILYCNNPKLVSEVRLTNIIAVPHHGRTKSLFIGSVCATPFAVCLICWVEVRGYQCHVSENIKRPHSLSLLVCVEISSLGWVYSAGSARVDVKAQGAVTQNCVFCKITCMAAFSLWNTPAQQGKNSENYTNSKFVRHR